MSIPLYSGGIRDKNQPARLDEYWRVWRSAASTPGERMAGYQILRTQYAVSDFVAWQRNGTLELNPNFQRRSVWKKGAKSYLIDTIVRGLSIPIIFLRDVPVDLQTLQSKRDVVDGQQRLRTVLAYVDPALLKNFDNTRDDFRIDPTHNPDLGGKSFAQLPREYKRQILDYQFSVHVFPPDTDDREILQIFARMNATGMNLNAQELRNAEFFGHFKTLAYNIATEQLTRWREWGIFSPDQIARMNEVDLTSEFMILIMQGQLEKNNTIINAFYRDFDASFPDEQEVANRFRTTLDRLETLFSAATISSYFRTRTMFYALFATVYGLLYGLRNTSNGRTDKPGENYEPLINARPKQIRPDIVKNIVQSASEIRQGEMPEEVLRAVRGGTSHASQRRIVIGYLAGKDDDPCRRPQP
jgi:hypothetical protein